MNHYSKVKYINNVAKIILHDNPRIIMYGLGFALLIVVPLIPLWVWTLSQYSYMQFIEYLDQPGGVFPIVWIVSAGISIIWGSLLSTWFELLTSKIILQYQARGEKVGSGKNITLNKVCSFTFFKGMVEIFGSIIPAFISFIFGVAYSSVSTLIAPALVDHSDRSFIDTLKEDKALFTNVSGLTLVSQTYLTLMIIGLIFIIGLFLSGGSVLLISLGLFGDVILGSVISIFILVALTLGYYQVLASSIIGCLLYVWAKSGKNPEEFQKLFIERSLNQASVESLFR